HRNTPGNRLSTKQSHRSPSNQCAPRRTEHVVKKPHPVSTSRIRFNWRLWFALGALTELFLLYVARWWAPSPVTYFLAVLFLPVMVLTGFWSFKYFRVVQLNL